MGKFILIVLAIIFLFILSIGLFIRKIIKMFGISFKSTIQKERQNEQKDKFENHEVLYKNDETTVLRGEAKRNDFTKQ